MKTKFFTCAVLSLLLVGSALPTNAEPQRRQTPRRSTTRRRSPSAPRTTTTAAAATEAREARELISNQIKNLSRFLYVYGRVANSAEVAARDLANTSSRSQRATEAANRTRESLATLTSNFRNVRAGLDDLARRFENTRSLNPYLPQISNAAIAAGQAEQLVAANQLDEAGRKLIDAVNSLTDGLARMAEQK